MKKIIITGATGLIGKKLSELLHQKGYYVISFTRNTEKSKELLPFADEHIKWTANIEDEWHQKIEDAFAVVNLAGTSIGGKKWTKEYKNEILSSRIDATNSIVGSINNARLKPKVLLNVSAIGYYNDNPEIENDEKSPNGNNFLSEVTRNWENAAKKVSGEVRLIIPRLGVVLDKNEGALPKMLAPYKYFAGGPVGSGRQYISWIHIEDLVNIFIWAIENENISSIINCVAPNPVKMNEFAKITGKILGKPSFLRVPAFIIKLILGEASILILNGSKVISNVLLQNKYKFQYNDLETALTNILKKEN